MSKVLFWDKETLSAIREYPGGNIAVEIVPDTGEHHMSVRREARKIVAENLGSNYHVNAYLGVAVTRFGAYSGRTVRWRRYSVVRIG